MRAENLQKQQPEAAPITKGARARDLGLRDMSEGAPREEPESLKSIRERNR